VIAQFSMNLDKPIRQTFDGLQRQRYRLEIIAPMIRDIG
jgi:hypothetical protein